MKESRNQYDPTRNVRAVSRFDDVLRAMPKRSRERHKLAGGSPQCGHAARRDERSMCVIGTPHVVSICVELPHTCPRPPTGVLSHSHEQVMLRRSGLLRVLVARDNSAAPLSGLWARIFDLLHSPEISRENFDQIFGARC